MLTSIAPEPVSVSPLQRLELLCDPDSLQLLRTAARSRGMGAMGRDGDGVLAGSGVIDGRPVFCFAQDTTVAGGSLGQAHADTVVRLHELAERARAPVVGFIASAGARLQEGLAALDGYGRLFRQQVRLSGSVPQISVICGPAAGGGAYAPALTDFVIMTEQASMFLTGPGVVAKVTGETISPHDLGGPRVHAGNGVCHVVAASDSEAATLARQLLAHLPQHAGDRLPLAEPCEPSDGAPDDPVPSAEREVYDIRAVIAALVDSGRLLEISPRFARNVICGFARLRGQPLGIVANQPLYLGGVLDSRASQKAARFVRTCNAFGVPLLALVDTPGFLPGAKQEAEGIIRHGAKLVHAFAESTVPRVSLVVRKAFGGAAIAMNSKGLGADYVFAWPGAQIGVMGATQAVEIINRREIAAAVDPDRARAALSVSYIAEHLTAQSAAAQGFVDEVVAPTQTRARLAAALNSLRLTNPTAPAGNIQL